MSRGYWEDRVVKLMKMVRVAEENLAKAKGDLKAAEEWVEHCAKTEPPTRWWVMQGRYRITSFGSPGLAEKWIQRLHVEEVRDGE